MGHTRSEMSYSPRFLEPNMEYFIGPIPEIKKD